jgi:hypothetical protein
MMRLGIRPVPAGVSALLLLAACVPYKPMLSLENSPHTIPVKILIQPLHDASPPEDKEHPAQRSFSQTGADSLEGDLGALVTQAILADFRSTSVFQSIRTEQKHPDLILGGTIHRFYGQVSIPSWLLIPGVGWAAQIFWSPVQEWEGEVDLELTLSTPTGLVLGSYRGHADYEEIADYDSRYWSSPHLPAHRRLNQAFTEAIGQIRDRMLRDRDRLTAVSGR